MLKKVLGQGRGLGLVLLLTLILLVTSYSLLVTDAFAEDETFTITTYYPSPYGSYNELSTNKFAVGYATSDEQPNTAGAIRLKAQPGVPTTWARGKEGEIAYSESKDVLYVSNGSTWVAQGGGAPVVATFYGMADCPSVGGTWTKLYEGRITTFAYLAGSGAAGGNSLCVATFASGSGGYTLYQFWAQGYNLGGITPIPCCVCIHTE